MYSTISPQSAPNVSVAAWILFFVLFAILEFTTGTSNGIPVARMSAGTLLLALLAGMGTTLASLVVVNSKKEIAARTFFCWAIDLALFPIVILIPAVFIPTALGKPIAILATPWFGDNFANLLGFEIGSFAVLVSIPLAKFVWPVLLRTKLKGPSNGLVVAPRPWMVACWFAAYSITVFFLGATLTFNVLVFGLWFCFYLFYRRLHSRFPKLEFPDLLNDPRQVGPET